MTTLTIETLRVPAALDAADASDFRAYAALSRQICDEAVGLPELSATAAELLPLWQDGTDFLRAGYLARAGGEVIGAVEIAYAQEDDAHSAEIDLLVPQAQWGHGVEDALLDAAEADAFGRGRTALQTWTLHRPVESERMLVPQTGWGRVPSTALAEFFTARGYRLEQVERNSAYDLQGDDAIVRQALADAEAIAGSDYRVISWTIPTPPELRDGYAAILARLSTDAPSGDMDYVAEQYDADRVMRSEARLMAANRMVSVTAVEHVPTGELVAYNQLVIGEDRTTSTHQFGTLVSKEHRGHRLGMIVKCANLLRWREIAPDSPAVSTFNAEENRPMLDINEAIGFRPASYAGAWQKRV